MKSPLRHPECRDHPKIRCEIEGDELHEDGVAVKTRGDELHDGGKRRQEHDGSWRERWADLSDCTTDTGSTSTWHQGSRQRRSWTRAAGEDHAGHAASAAEENRNTARRDGPKKLRRAPRSMAVLAGGASLRCQQQAPVVEAHGGERRVWQRRACGADESGKPRSWASV